MNSYRTFVVEDDEDDWQFLREAFEEVGCSSELRHYDDPSVMLAALESLPPQQYPDLIVLDNRTQGLNSREVTEQLRLHPQYGRIAVVVYSSAVVRKMQHDLLQAGTDLCLGKGLSLSELKDHVRRFCELIAQKKGG